ncbi:MAG TPA: nitroreductase family protein [Candidatus Omnitrophota bacterium]|nr:nitroreductase family protein [Candidatus Omnitrophota bacterium]HPT07424.1 nitroreductase family protein [Candidatus Omnitrophota bacterium]
MSFLSIDETKCSGDGRCVDVCPNKVLEINDKSHLPQVAGDGQERCIQCGHCVAVCPRGALSLACMRPEDCQRLNPDWRISPDHIEQLLKGRRSIRCYKDQPVEQETLEKVIDIARYAPSGINRQPVCWALINSKEKVHQVAELVVAWMRRLIAAGSPLVASFHMDNLVAAWERNDDRICRGAPSIVVVYGPKEDVLAPPACTIALTYFELAATSFGLGTCWGGYVHMALNNFEDARTFFGFSGRVRCYGAMMVGYPKPQYFRIPARNKPHIKRI